MPSRRRSLVLGPVAAVVVASCGAAEAGWTAAAADFAEPASYRYTLLSRCGERSLIGEFAIEVRDRAVVSVDPLDRSAETVVEYGDSDIVPTLGELITELREAEAAGADRTSATFDGDDGHPVEIKIDYDSDAIDDEACYSITEYDVEGG